MPVEHAIQGITISDLARQFGTPLFVYDGEALRGQWSGLRDRLHPALEMFYSLKANPNVSVCAMLRSCGARAEVSSLAELVTAQRAGVSPEDIIFLGPGKSRTELATCLRTGIYAIVCESFAEISLVDELARAAGVMAPVVVRVNPGFSVKGSGLTMSGAPRQFGIDDEQLLMRRDLAREFANVRLMGVHVYMGTRILSEDVVVENTARIFDLAERLAAALEFPLEFVDIGGGLGVAYFDGERDLDAALLTERLNPMVERFHAAHPLTRLALEVGRYLVAPGGTYVVGVRYVKTSMGEQFAVADGGTNHHMAAVGIGSFVKRNFPIHVLNRMDETETTPWTVAGPLCTPNDTLGRAVPLPAVEPGDLIGVMRSGAYGPTASPILFLSHGYPAEVLVDDGQPYLIRHRDTVEDLLRGQILHDPARVVVAASASAPTEGGT